MSKERVAAARIKSEIARILQDGRNDHAGYLAVLALIQVLSVLDPVNNSDLITHISTYFYNVYELFRNTRDSLVKILGSVGFVFIPKPHALYSLRPSCFVASVSIVDAAPKVQLRFKSDLKIF